jgi:hypothetical protein
LIISWWCTTHKLLEWVAGVVFVVSVIVDFRASSGGGLAFREAKLSLGFDVSKLDIVCWGGEVLTAQHFQLFPDIFLIARDVLNE